MTREEMIGEMEEQGYKCSADMPDEEIERKYNDMQGDNNDEKIENKNNNTSGVITDEVLLFAEGGNYAAGAVEGIIYNTL